MPVVSKPCIFAGSCPGDLGDTEVLWFGRQLCISKASNIIKVFGALETALSYINTATIGCKRQRKCLTRAYWVLFLSWFLPLHGTRQLLQHKSSPHAEGPEVSLPSSCRHTAGVGNLPRQMLRLNKHRTGVGQMGGKKTGGS